MEKSKEEMKMIERFAHVYNAATIAAGVYSGTDTTVLITQFNIIVTGMVFSHHVYDGTTLQQISGVSYCRPSFNAKRDNPAITGADIVRYQQYVQTGFNVHFPMYVHLSASEQFTIFFGAYVNAVTANNLTAQWNTTIKYLCPEDYLSVEGVI